MKHSPCTSGTYSLLQRSRQEFIRLHWSNCSSVLVFVHLFVHWTFLSPWHGHGTVIDTEYQTQTALKALPDWFWLVHPESMQHKGKYWHLFIITECVDHWNTKAEKSEMSFFTLDQWFSRCRPWTGNISVTWEFVRNAGPTALGERGHRTAFLANLPDNSFILSARELLYSNYHDTFI